jgi:hypothetical protein
MEARYAWLEALVTNMAAQVKSITFGPRKAKDKKNYQSYGSYANPRLFSGSSF